MAPGMKLFPAGGDGESAGAEFFQQAEFFGEGQSRKTGALGAFAFQDAAELFAHGSTKVSVGKIVRKSAALRVMSPWNRSAKAAIKMSATGRLAT